MALNFLPPPALGGQATAQATGKGVEPLVLPPIMYTAAPVVWSPTLVPLDTGMAFKMGQSGVFCSFEVNVKVIDLHEAGDLERRSELFQQQIAWMLKALDTQAAQFNAARQALGMHSQWVPSGQLQQVPVAATAFTSPLPFTPGGPGYVAPPAKKSPFDL